ncbi:MAG: tRNA (adenosine(37)-N6)-threonylcarbamoyltransferase complex dimerization subunit type 1 TsaB [Terriglobales bacterium]
MPQLLLAIDTSGRNGSLALALAEEGKPEVELVEAVPLAGGTFSAQLVPQIAELLGKHGYRKSDLAAFAVVSGPGSFTGLRVGLAAIKALAEVLGKPIGAVSLLEAVACASGEPGRILAALDAGRGEVYVGDYEIADFAQRHSECLVARDEFVAEAKSSAKRVVTPDVALADFLHAAGVSAELVSSPNSEAIARLGWQHIQRRQTIRPEDLEANYIRRSDAEIFSSPRR